ncbi:MAG TPA: glycosyltransferase family 4 protein [Methylomirabilota bacterium]|jgi:glycosyltransferase involved in cell wall biosynthesis
MRVVVSSVGGFHHFELAGELHRRGALERLYTGYPRSRVRGVPLERVETFPYVVAPATLLYRWGWPSLADRLSWSAHESLDAWVARRLPACDVFVANHANGLRSFGAAASAGARCVADCGQAHVEFVREALREEYRRWDVPYGDYPPPALAKRLAEYERADLITVPSEFCRRTFADRGLGAKTAVAPYGVDLEAYHPEPRRPTRFEVLYVGALTLRKGFPYLLQALEHGRPRDIDVTFVGARSQEAAGVLGRFGHVGFRERGHLPRATLHQAYSQAGVMVLPSLVEGLALVIAQAMACGLPVIATPNTGAEDLITDGIEGFIVPPRDPKAIRERVMALYESPQRREAMGAAALARARSLGGWTTYGDRVMAAYEAVIRRPAARLASQPA